MKGRHAARTGRDREEADRAAVSAWLNDVSEAVDRMAARWMSERCSFSERPVARAALTRALNRSRDVEVIDLRGG